jgi:hypothetical protein
MPPPKALQIAHCFPSLCAVLAGGQVICHIAALNPDLRLAFIGRRAAPRMSARTKARVAP